LAEKASELGGQIRVLVVGGSGFLGRRMLSCLGPERGLGTYHRNPFPGGVAFDAGQASIRDLLDREHGHFTHALLLHGAIDVERCATDPVGTAALNVDNMLGIIKAVAEAGIMPVFASTDYVFDGVSGSYRETDEPAPCTEYGRQKLTVERRVAELGERALIVRLSRVVGRTVGTHSVLGPMVADICAGKPLRCAVDQRFSPADVDDVTGALLRLLETKASGLFHVAGPESFSRMELARLLADHIHAVDPLVHAQLMPCRLHELPFHERRPLDTSLVIEKLQARIAWPFRRMDEICAAVALEQFA
jgi:dTDP-4-dehydrorhamnose reductase